MAEEHSLPSPKPNQSSFFLGSPRFFSGSFKRSSSSSSSSFEFETAISPTSILDSKKASNFNNPFGYDQNISKSTENKGLGVVLVDSFTDEKNLENFTFVKPKLKIQIPTLSSSATESPKSPAEFGTKTPKSPFLSKNYSFRNLNSDTKPTGSPTAALTLSEMELSEDYTCVISHGPNPKTIRIYDNCIVESCCDVVDPVDLKKESQNFRKLCSNCNNNFVDGKDRAEKGHYSNECLCQEIALFDGKKNSEMGNGY